MAGLYTSLCNLRSVTIFWQLKISHRDHVHHIRTNVVIKARFIVLLTVGLKTVLEETQIIRIKPKSVSGLQLLH